MFELIIFILAVILLVVTLLIRHRHWIYNKIEHSLLAEIKSDPINNYRDHYRAIKVYKRLLDKLDDYFL